MTLHRLTGFGAAKRKADAHDCAGERTASATRAAHTAAKGSSDLGQKLGLNA